MSNDAAALTARADELFTGALADAVKTEISKEAGRESAATLGFADHFYNRLSTGTLRGLPTITWNGPDQFVFIPTRDRPFAFTTSAGLTITPQVMPTDGGSIPRMLQGFQRFSAWGYAPAFIIHDWLFHAKKLGRLEHRVSFEEAADVMAEAIKTLMVVGFQDVSGRQQILDKREDTLYLMHIAVSSPIARRLWDDDSTAVDLRLGNAVTAS